MQKEAVNMPTTVYEQAHAKINLALDVTGKLENGYHTVRMIMQSISLCDDLSFSKGDNGAGVKLTTDSEALNREIEAGGDNLIFKAARLFKERTGIACDVNVTLSKRIPIAAGLAGGSADAAATLRGLNRLYGAGLSNEELREIGVRIGADVPFCIEGGICLAEGIGEKLTPLTPLANIPTVLVKPPVGVSTPVVYREYDSLTDVDHPDVDKMLDAISRYDNIEVTKLLKNVLEPVTGAIHPVIGDIEEKLMNLGADNAVMSGSGPTVFGVFDSEKKSLEAAKKMQVLYPDCFVGAFRFHNALRPRFE